jgi:hypothetical protein
MAVNASMSARFEGGHSMNGLPANLRQRQQSRGSHLATVSTTESCPQMSIPSMYVAVYAPQSSGSDEEA